MSQSISVSSITDVVTTIISNSMQKAGNFVVFDQSIILDCSDIASILIGKLETCMEEFKDWTLCDQYLSPLACSANSIELDQIINVDLSSAQLTSLNTDINNSIQAGLSASLQSQVGGLTFSDSTTLKINSVISDAQTVVNLNLLKNYTAWAGQQTLNFKGGTYSYVVAKQSMDVFSSQLQSYGSYNTDATDLVASIAVDIKQQLSSVSLIMNIAFSVLGFVILFGLCLVVLKVLARKKK